MKRSPHPKIVVTKWVIQMHPRGRETPSSWRSQQQFRTAGTTTCLMLRQTQLLLRMPHKIPTPGTKPKQVFVATGSIHETRDAGRAWYEHSKKVLEAEGFVVSRTWTNPLLSAWTWWTRGYSAHARRWFPDCLHDSLQDMKRCAEASCAHASPEGTDWHCCAVRSDHFQGWQQHESHSSRVDAASRTYEHWSGKTNMNSAITSAKITRYRSVLGQLLWLETVGVSLALLRSLMSMHWTHCLTWRDARQKWALSFLVMSWTWKPVPWSVPQTLLSHTLRKRNLNVVCETGRFHLSTITSWQSTTIKRVVRSTITAERYAVSEVLEPAQWCGHLLTEAHMARVFTDSDSLANTEKKDVGQSHEKRCLCPEKRSDQWRTFRWRDCRLMCKSKTPWRKWWRRTFLPRSSTVVRTSP